MSKELFFDTETTGLPTRGLPIDHPSQPHITQVGAVLREAETKRVLGTLGLIIHPDGWTVGREAAKLTGISTEFAKENGVPRRVALSAFNHLLKQADVVVGHNLSFDIERLHSQYAREGQALVLTGKTCVCTMLKAVPYVKKITSKSRHDTDYKWPRLVECMEHFFNEGLDGAHDAMVDILATIRVYDEIRRIESETQN